MIPPLDSRFAAATEAAAYPPSIICHPGGVACPCGRDSVVWYVEAKRKTELCAVCLQRLIASLEATADQLALEAAQERALAAKLRETYRYAVALGSA